MHRLTIRVSLCGLKAHMFRYIEFSRHEPWSDILSRMNVPCEAKATRATSDANARCRSLPCLAISIQKKFAAAIMGEVAVSLPQTTFSQRMIC